MSDNAAAAPAEEVQVTRNTDELMNEVRSEISELKKKIDDMDSQLQQEGVKLLTRLDLLKEDKEQLTQLRKQETILVQSQQQQQAPENDDIRALKKRRIEIWTQLKSLAADTNLPPVFAEDTVYLEVGQNPLSQVVHGRIFVRKCYREMFTIVMNKLFGEDQVPVAISGTPGIGKSLFGILLIVELVRLKKTNDIRLKDVNTIVYESQTAVGDNALIYQINVEDGTVFPIYRFNMVALTQKKDSTILIKDGPCSGTDSALCRKVWICSPRPNGFKKWTGNTGTREQFLAPFDTSELANCVHNGCAPPTLFDSQHLSTEARKAMDEATEYLEDLDDNANRTRAILERWVADLGPIARLVFNPGKSYDLLQQDLDNARRNALHEMIKIAQNDGDHNPGFKASHRLLIMVPIKEDEEYTKYSLSFASVSIGRKILENAAEEDIKAARSLIGQLQGKQQGNVFEAYAHHILGLGGEFKMYSFPSGSGNTAEPNPVTVELGVNSKWARKNVSNKVVKSTSPDFARGFYYVPEDPTFPVVDSWSVDFMFQMTIANDHGIASGAKLFTKLRDCRKIQNKLVWVVPSTNKEHFRSQKYVTSRGALAKNSVPGGWNGLEQFVIYLDIEIHAD